ncbi:MAG: preprotein translocase subunit SecE [Planctomycetaceae bacterium]
MSREVATSSAGSDPPLLTNLVQTAVYKPSQGRLVRQLTALAIWVVVAMGCYRLYITLRGTMESATWAESAIPLGLCAAGVWFGFRVVNWPRFADFLIAVEAEMKKVTWPSKEELVRASIVVIATIIILAMTLFLFDIVWQWWFAFIGVTT